MERYPAMAHEVGGPPRQSRGRNPENSRGEDSDWSRLDARPHGNRNHLAQRSRERYSVFQTAKNFGRARIQSEPFAQEVITSSAGQRDSSRLPQFLGGRHSCAGLVPEARTAVGE